MNPGFRGVGGFGREFESIVVGVALTVFVLGVEYMVGACCQVAVEVVGSSISYHPVVNSDSANLPLYSFNVNWHPASSRSGAEVPPYQL